MGKSLTVIIVICASAHFIEFLGIKAAPASPIPFHNPQPDNTTTPMLTIEGGPTSHRVLDEYGYVVVVNETTKEYVYAEYNNVTGDLNATAIRVGALNTTQLDELDIQPRLQPSEEVRERDCGKFCDDPKEDFDEMFSFSYGGLTIREADKVQMQPGSRHLQQQQITKLYSGVLRNIVILMQFSDHGERKLPSLTDFSYLFNGKGTGTAVPEDDNIAPTGSVRDVFLTSSYDKLELLSTVIGWVKLPETEAYYADRTSGSTSKFEEALTFALDTVEKIDGFSFKHYDKDKDMNIDSLVFIHSGYAAEWGAEDCFGAQISDRIWSHKWKTKWSNLEGYQAKNYFTSSALWDSCGETIARIGTISHELGHVLELPDLYLGGSGIGSFGLMGNSWGFDQSQNYPPILSSWSKIFLKWITPRIAQKSGRYTLKPVITTPDVIKIQIGYPNNEYLLIENRHRIENSFEAKLPIQGGLLIYHIDDMAKFHKNPGFVGQAGWPENGNHYRVAILQRDGEYNLEKGENRGDEGDLFVPDTSDELNPGNTFYPNTDAYRHGKIRKTDIRIYDIVSDGEDITFSIDLPENNSPVPKTDPVNYANVPVKKLTTTYAADIGSHGCMFDVVAGANPIIISSLDIHVQKRSRIGDTSSLVKVIVYTKEKSYRGYEGDKEVWQQICGLKLDPAGTSEPTVIPEEAFQAVTVLAGATQAFYIMLDKPDLRYSRGRSEGANAASNIDLKILQGSGIKGEFGEYGGDVNKTWSPRIFNGDVYYYVINPSDSDRLGAANTMRESHTLTTNFNGQTGHYGNMWNVRAKATAVTVYGMEVHIRKKGEVNLEIWTKLDKYQGHENNIDVWTQICCHGKINGQGEGRPTEIYASHDFTPVEIEQGRVRAFYVNVDSRGDIRYNNKYSSMTTISDDIIEIFDGAGLKYGSSKIFEPRGFNGSIKYTASATDVLANAIARQRKELLATFAGENGSYGIMFDMKAKNDINLEGIDIHTRATSQVTVELYTRAGASSTHASHLSSWALLCSVEITGKGSYGRTSLPDHCLSDLVILRDEVLGVYVTLTTNDLRYTTEKIREVGDIYADNDDMELAIGTGIGSYPLGDDTFMYPKRIFNGVMKYSTIDPPPPVQATQLQTTMLWGNRSFGNIFTVVAKQSGVKVLSIDIHTRSYTSEDVEVWTRSGPYDGYTQSMVGWEKVASVNVVGQGNGKITSIPQNEFQPVEIQTQIQSFYVTLKRNEILYTNGDNTGMDDQRAVKTDDVLTIHEGLGVGSYLLSNDTPTYSRRIFNGNINYVIM